MIYIYKVLGLILIPLIKLNVTIRIIRGKEMPNRYKERFGESAQLVKNDKKLIWIHAASVGEFKSSDYIIKNYHEKYKILITTTTVSAAKYAIKTYGNKIIHQFAPLDVSIWIKKFLKRWNPTLIIWIESDLWPATLSIIKEFKINALLVNVRLSPKSFKRWILIPSFYNNLLSCFSDIFAQSKDKKSFLVIELKKGRASDSVVGQIQRYMGYIKDEFLETGQKVKGIIIALENDTKVKRALSVTTDIDFYQYKINFDLIKN